MEGSDGCLCSRLAQPVQSPSPRKRLNLKFPNKYVEDGVAEEVPYEQYAPVEGRPVFYLPHHAVIREDKQTTKTRVVFDTSARDLNGVSK